MKLGDLSPRAAAPASRLFGPPVMSGQGSGGLAGG